MRIGCLQFAPKLGEVNQNMNRADAVLSKSKHEEALKNLDLLVLPELAFSGYNFKSLAHITPFLEPTASGITQLWARTQALKYNCAVSVGYPEKVDISKSWPASPEYYNSTVTINRDGETVAHYRKHFLYSTDEKWALEGPDGFGETQIPGLGKIALGICMDLNPYRFKESPWEAFEFAHHVLHIRSNLVIVSMAWTTKEPLELYSRMPHDPDMHTLAYWVRRLEPLIRDEEEGEIIVVLANRTGEEDGVVYTGTSCVLGIKNGEVTLYGILGRQERDLLVVDTRYPVAKLIHEDPEESMEASTNTNGSSGSKNSQESYITDPDYYEPSIGEILHSRTPISPVEAKSPHPFFNSHPDEDQRRELRSSMVYDEDDEYDEAGWAKYAEMLKSSNANSYYQNMKSAANGPNRRDTSTPNHPPRRDTATPDSWERPSSPKSRNASRNRFNVAPSPALREHDLADHVPARTASIPSITDRGLLGSNSVQAIRNTARLLNPPILYSQWDLDPTDPDNEIVEIIDEAKGIRESVVYVNEVDQMDPEDFYKQHGLTYDEPMSKKQQEEETWAAELPSHSRRRAERLLPYSQANSEVSVRPKSTGW